MSNFSIFIFSFSLQEPCVQVPIMKSLFAGIQLTMNISFFTIHFCLHLDVEISFLFTTAKCRRVEGYLIAERSQISVLQSIMYLFYNLQLLISNKHWFCPVVICLSAIKFVCINFCIAKYSNCSPH